MQKRYRFPSVALSRLVLTGGLLAMPAVGHSGSLQILDWVPPTSPTLSTSSPADFITNTKDPTHTVPMWLGTDNGFSYAIVGTDPTVKGPTAITNINAKIIPLRFSYSGVSPALVFDPENADACSPARTPALNMVQQSPLFKPVTLPGVYKGLGTAQFLSLYERANFWVPFVEPKGVNANYQVLFQQVLTNRLETNKYTIQIGSTFSATLPYTVPGTVVTDPTWCHPVAEIDVNDFDNLVQTTIIPELKIVDVVPDVLPIFLLSNVVLTDSSAGCCILGYHNAYLSAITTGVFVNRLQTYVVANYDSTACTKSCPAPGNFTGAFPTAPDLVAISNTMAGWMNNPTTLNPTPPWSGTINGVGPACQDIFEVAYPPALSTAPLITITAPDKNIYHVQDLAFKGWFYGDGVVPGATTPNSGYAGVYSMFGTLAVPNTSC
jgi:hypothetical protein